MNEVTPTTTLRTPESVAEELGLSANWLRTQARHGRIQHVRLGRRILFGEADIVALIATNRRAPSAVATLAPTTRRRRSA